MTRHADNVDIFRATARTYRAVRSGTSHRATDRLETPAAPERGRGLSRMVHALLTRPARARWKPGSKQPASRTRPCGASPSGTCGCATSPRRRRARTLASPDMRKPFFTHLKALAPRTRKVAASSLWEARRLTDDTPVDRRTTYVVAAALARADAERAVEPVRRVARQDRRLGARPYRRSARRMTPRAENDAAGKTLPGERRSEHGLRQPLHLLVRRQQALVPGGIPPADRTRSTGKKGVPDDPPCLVSRAV